MAASDSIPGSVDFLRLHPDASITYLRSLIEYCPIAIVVLDHQHRFQMCNRAFETLFQFVPSDLAQADFDELIGGRDKFEEAQNLSRQVVSGMQVHALAQRRRRDGMMLDVEIYGIPLVVDGSLSGVYGLYQDVTERTRAQNAYRELSHLVDNLQHEERRRIARNLHDSTSQEFAVLHWNLNRLAKMIGEDDGAVRTLVQQTQEIAQQCSQRIRSASYLLHPPMLGDQGLVPGLRWLAEGFEQRSGIVVTIDASPDVGRFPDVMEIAIFRVAQESLANVLRHSGSDRVHVSLKQRGDWLRLSIADRGKGVVTERLPKADGVGVAGMRERIEQLDGVFSMEQTEDGMTVVAELPIGIHQDG